MFRRLIALGAAALMAGALPLVVPQSATAQTVVDTLSIPSDTSIVSTTLAPGHYHLHVSGVVDYDNERPGDQLADAECSTDLPFWDDPVDWFENQSSAGVFSTWHRDRFALGTAYQGQLPISLYKQWILLYWIDTLDVGVGLTHPVLGFAPKGILEWAPVTPTPVNGANELDAGCNEANHEYVAELVVPPGTQSVEFQFLDPNPVDNDGAFTLTIEALP